MKPNAKLYMELFKRCADHRNLKTGQMVHSHFLHSEFHHHVYLQKLVINMYVKCRDMELARRVFDEMTNKDMVSYSMLISGYSQISKFDEALRLYIDLMKTGLRPDQHTFASALKSGAGMQSDAVGIGIHGTCIKCGGENDLYVGNALVDMYGKAGSIKDAKKVFHQLVKKDTVSWTSMLLAYAHHGLVEEVVDLFEEMRYVGVQPNAITLSSALKSAAGMQSDATGSKIHGICIKCGCEKNVYVANSLVDMYGKVGSIEDAKKVFHGFVKRDIVTWNSMLHAYEHHGLGQEALDLFEEMRGVGLQLDEITFSSALKSAACMQSDIMGSTIHGTCIKNGFEKNMFVGNALVNMYGKVGRIEDTEKAFHQLMKKDIVSWNSMLYAYAHHGLSQESVDLFEKMLSVGLMPDKITFLSELKACSHSGLVEKVFLL